MTAQLGTIEGYYGAPWSWQARAETVQALAPHGYRFFLYAPKADAYLRKRWQEDHPAETVQALSRLAQHCKSLGVVFGVGLSPFELYRNFDDAAKAALARKLAGLDAIGCDMLAILFDDMRGDLPDLARMQAGIIHWIAERTKAKRLIVCPSYYTDDPVLDRYFGRRPERYLEEFGERLDPAIDIFWTGEEVCSREYSVGHLERVSTQLRRKPFLWDNYPVNDGQRMSQFLHLRAFTGRPASIGAHLAAHAVNPALQPVLTRIPMLTLAQSYRLGDAYQYRAAFERAAVEILGTDLARCVNGDIYSLQDSGLDRLGKQAEKLRERYARFDHPGAREIVAWLDGVYRFKDEWLEV
ncbi:MAG: beta-N-acetylglucosaminidase domain-containing protein [Proteobacteria bacterium]|nr:beta-N-acetylglucosaminidase domain-containing protein [Pseudomonadota bacterium]